MTEDQIQAQIFKWFHNTYCLKSSISPSIIFSVPNGGTRNLYEAQKLKSTGLLPGVSDLIIVHKGGVYFFEVKSENGRPSVDQLLFKSRIEANGLKYFLVRSLDEFQKIVLSL